MHPGRPGNRLGTRWRGKLPVPPRAHPLVRRLYGEMNAQMTTVGEVAQRSGLSSDTLLKWRGRHVPTLQNFEAALNALDLELRIVPRAAPAAAAAPRPRPHTTEGARA